MSGANKDGAAAGATNGTWLVASRAFRDGSSTRTWRIVTAVLFVIGLAVAILPRVLADDVTSYVLVADPDVPDAVLEQVAEVGASSDFTVEIERAADDAETRAAVEDGQADLGVAIAEDSSTLYVPSDGAGVLTAVVAQLLAAQATADALVDAGLTAAQIQAIQSIPPPAEVVVGDVADESRAGVGFITGILLYGALILTGTAIATAVATEKSTRISEVLLAVLRPRQLLVGTVIGVGLLGLIQVSALALPAGIGLVTGDTLNLPSASAGDLALAFSWLLLGLSLYAFVFAALGSLVEKIAEVGPAIVPANVLLIGSYMIAVFFAANNPNGVVSTAASLFPFSAPMVMPVRWTSGLVPGWQLALAMALTALTAIALASLASRIYARGVTSTGRRMSLREAMRQG